MEQFVRDRKRKKKPQKRKQFTVGMEAEGLPQGLRSRLYRAQRCLERAQNRRHAGKPDAAETLLAEGWRTLQNLPPLPDVIELRSIISLERGTNLADAGHSAKAENLFAEEVAWLETLGTASEAPLHGAMLEGSWAECLQASDRHDEALAHLDSALAKLRACSASELASEVHDSLHLARATSLASLGRVQETDAAITKADPKQASAPTACLYPALSRIVRGTELQSQGNHLEAERMYASALDHLDRLPPSPSVQQKQLTAMINRASCLSVLGRKDDAEDLFQRVLNRVDSISGNGEAFLHRVAARINISETLKHLGQPERAMQSAKEALQLLDERCDTRQLEEARAHAAAAYATALDLCGRGEEAEEWHARAKKLHQELPGAKNEAGRIALAQAHADHGFGLCGRGSYGPAEDEFAAAYSVLEPLDDLPVAESLMATVLLNWAVAITNQAAHDRAEPFYQAAQEIYDSMPSTPSSEIGRTHVRWNRAINLMYLGKWGHAQLLHAEAGEIADSNAQTHYADRFRGPMLMAQAAALRELPDARDAEPDFDKAQKILDAGTDALSRAMIRIARATSDSRYSKDPSAERFLREAMAILAPLPRNDVVVRYEALARSGLAFHYKLCSRFDDALVLVDDAEALLRKVPDSDATRSDRLGLITIRTDCLTALGHFARARIEWSAGRGLLEEMQDAPGFDVVKDAYRLAAALFHLARSGGLTVNDCADAADSLLAWLLDHTDFAEPGTAFTYGHAGLTRFCDEYLNWLVDVNCGERIGPLLSEFFGRYASAERASRADGDQATSIETLRRQIRTLTGKLGMIQHTLGSGHEEYTRLMNARHEACEALRDLRQAEAKARDCAHIGEITQFRLASALSGSPHALVILFRVSPSLLRDGDEHSATTPPRAVAVVVRAGVAPHVVVLPDTVGKGIDAYEVKAAGATPVALRALPSTRATLSVPLDARVLVEAVEAAWDALAPTLIGAERIYLALHQEMSLLPWPNGLCTERATQVILFHNIRQAVEALEQGKAEAAHASLENPMKAGWAHSLRIAPPDVGRPIALLSHSPPPGSSLPAIPCVHADAEITQRLWPDTHVVANDIEQLLRGRAAILQISSHGNATELYTGPDERKLSPYELERALDAFEPPTRLDVLMAIACSTSQADMAWWGEIRGWSALLQDRIRAMLGALFPIDDTFCSLFVLLLHRAWQRCGDLRLALAQTREQLRHGEWCQDEIEGTQIQSLWVEALEVAAGKAPESFKEDVREKVARWYRGRRELYADDVKFRGVVEAFVIFG